MSEVFQRLYMDTVRSYRIHQKHSGLEGNCFEWESLWIIRIPIIHDDAFCTNSFLLLSVFNPSIATMIQGIFSYGKFQEEPTIAVFSEGAKKVNDEPKVANDVDLSPSSSSKLVRCGNRTSTNGILVGSLSSSMYGMRSVFCSHGYCAVDNCSCEAIAQAFLSASTDTDISEFTRQHYEQMTNNLQPPYLLILFEGKNMLSISSYFDTDFEIATYAPGTYVIRDTMISYIEYCEPNVIEMWSSVTDSIISSESTKKAFIDNVLSTVTNKIRSEMYCPAMPLGTGLMLMMIGKKLFVQSIDATKPAKKDKNKSKGVVNAFNFYSKTNYSSCEARNPNANINKMIAKEWNQLPEEEKRPYELMFEADKERVRMENGEMMSIDGVDADTESTQSSYVDNSRPLPSASSTENKRNLKPSTQVSGKKMTAYNIFIQHEKNFLAALPTQVHDTLSAQSLVGKLGGARWWELLPEEKSQYEAMSRASTINKGIHQPSMHHSKVLSSNEDENTWEKVGLFKHARRVNVTNEILTGLNPFLDDTEQARFSSEQSTQNPVNLFLDPFASADFPLVLQPPVERNLQVSKNAKNISVCSLSQDVAPKQRKKSKGKTVNKNQTKDKLHIDSNISAVPNEYHSNHPDSISFQPLTSSDLSLLMEMTHHEESDQLFGSHCFHHSPPLGYSNNLPSSVRYHHSMIPASLLVEDFLSHTSTSSSMDSTVDMRMFSSTSLNEPSLETAAIPLLNNNIATSTFTGGDLSSLLSFSDD